MRVRQRTSTKRRNHGQVYVSEVYYYANLIFQFVYQVNSGVVDLLIYKVFMFLSVCLYEFHAKLILGQLWVIARVIWSQGNW